MDLWPQGWKSRGIYGNPAAIDGSATAWMGIRAQGLTSGGIHGPLAADLLSLLL
jgi:hypothetical protein